MFHAVVRWVAAFASALVLALGLPATAAASHLEASVGLVDEIDGRQSSLAAVAYVSEHDFPWEVMLGNLRHREEAGMRITPTTTFIAAGRRLYWQRWFLSSGIALTDTDGANEVLSGPFQFMTGAGWSNRRISVSIRHLSNANTRGRNRGETFLLGFAW